MKDFTCGQEKIKLSLFADDLVFEKCSGLKVRSLKVNHEKTKTFVLGNKIIREVPSIMYNRCEVIRILGVHFSYDPNQKDVLNFRQTLKTIKKAINLLKWRGLSLLGRIQTFIVPKLMFRASVISFSTEFIKEANSICYNFI